MKIATVDDLLRELREHRLLQPDQLAELTPDLLARHGNVRLLAKYLLQRGWLTVYQMNQLFQGQAAALVLGPFRVMDKLGEGGVSQVFKAWDTRRKCVAAVKTIRSEHMANAEAVGRLQREMRVIAQLSHPNVVKAFDVDLVNERHYFAMEYVEGTDLGKMLKLSGPLPVRQACDFIRQAALGLQHAHELGLVHRDIKPGNLLVTGGGASVKILDMGMARLQLSIKPEEEPTDQLTVEGVLIGTADYLSPEQAKNPRTVDIRADIYSLGCTFFHVLTGEPPFPGKTVLEKIYKHQTAEPDWNALLEVTQQPALVEIIKKMMAKKAVARYTTPGEVAAALAPFV
jgi:serine/threonine-protein kinase